MITLLSVMLLILIGCFGFVLLFGAPYLPTLDKHMITALDLLDLKKGETMLELGCGDGKVLLAAAQRGWNVVGYELNPLLAALCWLRTRRYSKQVKVVWGNYWNKDWPPAQGIYAFILPRYMEKLNKIVMHKKLNSVKIVSFAFPISSQKATVERNGVYLYEYLF